MKKFKVTSPEGKSLVLTSQDDSPPSEQELEQVFGSNKLNEPEIQPIPNKPFSPDFGKAYQESYANPMDVVSGQAPVKFATSLYEQPKEALIKQAGLPDKGIKGLLTSLGIDLGAGLVGDTAVSGIGRALSKSAPKLIQKAESLVPKVLPPESGTIANQLKFGGEKTYQKELAPFIKKSKNYEELASSLRESEKKVAGERGEIYEANPVISGEAQYGILDEAQGVLTKARELGVLEPNQLSKIEKLIDNQVEFINNLPKDKASSTKFLQERKAAFQKMAEDIYGESTAPDERIAKQIHKALAKGYQTAIESISPNVKPINKTIGALIEGLQSASRLGEKEAVNIPPGRIETLLSRTPFLGRFFPLNEAKQIALSIAKRSNELPNVTGKIEKLMSKGKFREEMGKSSQVGSKLYDLVRRKNA